MARKKQQLINYHTSGVTNMPQVEDVALGELVVRHATDKPELLIKKDNNEFATFVDSGKVQSMITTSSTDLQGKIDAVSDNLRDNYATSASTVAAIEAVNTKLTRDYATSANTVAAIGAAIIGASAYFIFRKPKDKNKNNKDNNGGTPELADDLPILKQDTDEKIDGTEINDNELEDELNIIENNEGVDYAPSIDDALRDLMVTKRLELTDDMKDE